MEVEILERLVLDCNEFESLLEEKKVRIIISIF